MIIKNKLIYIIGKPGEGKTFVAAFVASVGYRRIYSNIDIFFGKKMISKKIEKIAEINSIEFDEEKGIVIIDELGLNVNSRNAMTKENKEAVEIPMLSRKKNVDVIYIAQADFMGDKYFRELAHYEIHMHSYFVSKDKLMFEAKIYTRTEGKKYMHKYVTLDLIEYCNLTGMQYDTLDSSRLLKGKK